MKTVNGTALEVSYVTTGNVTQLMMDMITSSTDTAPIGQQRMPALLLFARMSKDNTRILCSTEVHLLKDIVLAQHLCIAGRRP